MSNFLSDLLFRGDDRTNIDIACSLAAWSVVLSLVAMASMLIAFFGRAFS